MNTKFFLVIALISLWYVLHTVKKGRLSIWESFFWLMSSLVMLGLSVFPTIFDRLAVKLGIEYAPSLLFMICIVFLLFINFRNSAKISDQEKKIIELAQRYAILKESIKRGEKKK